MICTERERYLQFENHEDISLSFSILLVLRNTSGIRKKCRGDKIKKDGVKEKKRDLTREEENTT